MLSKTVNHEEGGFRYVSRMAADLTIQSLVIWRQFMSAMRFPPDEQKARRHRWTEGDDLVAFYLSRHGTRFLPCTETEIASRLGMPEGSLAMRMSNFAHLDGRQGLAHVAEQSRRIHRRYAKATEAELRPLVLRLLDAC
jgi:hypothetical protein